MSIELNASGNLPSQSGNPDFLAGGGEMGERMRSMDWSQTPLGPVESWPQSLKTCVRIILTSRQPMFVWWGKELINLYNDAYKAIVGGKHPGALGQPASQVWQEIWEEVGPRAETAIRNNEGTYDEALLLIMERNGYAEETYYTFSYSPVPGDGGGTDGIICANTDDTRRVIGERQLSLLRDLASRTATAQHPKEVCKLSALSLHINPTDLPFALIYLTDSKDASLELAGASGIEPGHAAAPRQVWLDDATSWPFQRVMETNQPTLVSGLGSLFAHLPSGSWAIPPHQAVLLPIARSGHHGLAGILLVGLNPFRLYDEGYQGFIQLIAGQMAASIAQAEAYEQERKRSEALAEIDKAKTLFFSNVSHELRTPLTLMLGPLEQVLSQENSLSPVQQDQLAIVQRNSLRLLKLVNTLLDFSRIEAGRVQAVFKETDICLFTAELGSAFRSAIEGAGLALHIDCGPIDAPVYIDRTMWERIIFNLLSNAFKFTFEGEISIILRQVEQHIELRVKDTGTGIAPEEFTHLFSRFHRVENARGRTHEGSGIGLAMVDELVRLHGGAVSVESTLGQGSTFIVSLPTGKEHLAKEQIADEEAPVNPTLNALPNLEQELAYMHSVVASEASETPSASALSQANKAKILVADDNADMREYLTSLLSDKYEVITVKDGVEALHQVDRDRPALILSDIMMPNLDGIGLLRKLRTTPSTTSIPLIFLSARAGEEAIIHGIEEGADDYLIKPFSARELVSKVDAVIKIAGTRQEAEKQLLSLFQQTPVAISLFKGPSFTIELANERALELWGKNLPEVLHRPSLEVFPELVSQGFAAILENVFLEAKPFIANEMEVELVRYGKRETLFLNFVYEPLLREDGCVVGVVGVGVDVSELVKARKAMEENANLVGLILESLPQIAWTTRHSDGEITYLNRQWYTYTGDEKDNGLTPDITRYMHAEDLPQVVGHWQQCVQTGQVFEQEYRLLGIDGIYRWMLGRTVPLRDEEGNITLWVGTSTDIHQMKLAEQTQQELMEKLAASNEELAAANEEMLANNEELVTTNSQLAKVNEDLDSFVYTASHDLKSPVISLIGLLSFLTKRLAGKVDEKEQEMLSMIGTSAKRLQNTIGDLTEILKIQRNTDNDIEQINVPTMFSDVLADLQGLIQENNALITTDFEVESLPYPRKHLRSILYNLLSNAIKYRSPNRAACVSVAIRQDTTGVVLSIRDNGLGLSPKQVASLFTMFKRFHNHVDGNGVGLYMIRRIVENNGGTMRVESTEGEGTTFFVYF